MEPEHRPAKRVIHASEATTGTLIARQIPARGLASVLPVTKGNSPRRTVPNAMPALQGVSLHRPAPILAITAPLAPSKKQLAKIDASDAMLEKQRSRMEQSLEVIARHQV